jgi:hypothetical protein
MYYVMYVCVVHHVCVCTINVLYGLYKYKQYLQQTVSNWFLGLPNGFCVGVFVFTC